MFDFYYFMVFEFFFYRVGYMFGLSVVVKKKLLDLLLPMSDSFMVRFFLLSFSMSL